jgi:hypothetical protein
VAAAVAMIAAAQDRPPAPETDPLPSLPASQGSQSKSGQGAIVVTAPRPDVDTAIPKPMLHGGLWHFVRGQTLGPGFDSPTSDSPVGRGGGSFTRFQFSTCLPGDDLASTLQHTAGDRSNLPRANICDPLNVTVGNGRITGRRACIEVSRDIGKSHETLNLSISGRYDARSMDVTVNANELTDGFAEGTRDVPRPKWMSWRITATRLGDCPADKVMGERKLGEAINLLFEPVLGEFDTDGI